MEQDLNVIVLGVSCFDGMASSTRVRNLLDPLLKKDEIIVHNLIYDKENYILKQQKGYINKINYLIIEFNFKNIISIVRFIWKGLNFIYTNKSANKKNIIYNYEYIDIKNLLFLLYAKIIGYKIILDIVEDNRYYTKFPSFINRLKLYSSITLTKLIPYISNSVITISYHLNDFILPFCKSKVPVYHIPISVNLEYFENREFEIPENFRIFYGGSFGEKDGLFYLIKSFDQICSKYTNIELVLTGRASKNDQDNLSLLIEKSPYKEKIILKGFLETNEYYETLNDCHIFCMTRINSNFANAGFPFKLGEFLSTGKFVIASRVGDVSKYLTNKKDSLLIEPNSVEELTNAISYILDNPGKLLSLGIQGRKVAESHFDSLILSNKLLNIFRLI